MIKVPLTEDSLRVALKRITDFQVVNRGKDEYNDAFMVLSESLGLDEDMLDILLDFMTDFFGDELDHEFSAGTIFGLIVGLIAADYGQEAS